MPTQRINHQPPRVKDPSRKIRRQPAASDPLPPPDLAAIC
jgi:hypothetical protein